jgi:hypothetical protein
MSHDCPIEGCQQRVPNYKLLCGAHWLLVPTPLKRAVYAAWKNGKGAGSEEHREACQAAIDFVHAKLQGGR